MNIADIASKNGVTRVRIGKYERAEDVPYIDAAKKLQMPLMYH